MTALFYKHGCQQREKHAEFTNAFGVLPCGHSLFEKNPEILYF